VDFQSLEDGTVTLRDRDSMSQDRLQPKELETRVAQRLRG